MLLGTIDPLEGSLLILPGRGLVALGMFLGRKERRTLLYWAWAFILIAVGVGDPDHFPGVLPAVSLKLLPHLAAFRPRHIAEMNAQVFETGPLAFLNLQIGVAAPCH